MGESGKLGYPSSSPPTVTDALSVVITIVYFLLYYKPYRFILGNPDHSTIILPEPAWLTSGVQSNPKDRTHKDKQQILRTS